MTLWQPWASLIAIGAKPYETRSRPPPTRLIGRRIAIHAAAKRIRVKDFDAETFDAISRAFGDPCWMDTVPLGSVVCTAILAEALPAESIPHSPFGDYRPGR
jgi:activating signal cointegrator 1